MTTIRGTDISPERTRELQLSCEFFPPRSEEGLGSLEAVAKKLAELQPDFYSCTYGAGGTTRDGTRETIARLLTLGYDAAPHLSIGNDSKETIFELLDAYRTLGVRRIVTLRGDATSGMGAGRIVNNAETLVRWIREHSGDHFHLEVAAYPEIHPDAVSPESDLDYFRAKVDAGANSAITQYFYSPYAYYDFIERCAKAGINIPIVPGIMPITNFEGIVRFSQKCGADVPRWLHKRLEALAALPNKEASLRSFGIEVLVRMCAELIEQGAPGLHFYALNRWGATRAICAELGLLARKP